MCPTEGRDLPDATDDRDEFDVSLERARELARDHERSAADRFRELQKLDDEPDGHDGEVDLEELHLRRLEELRGERPSIGRALLQQGKWLVIVLLAIVAVAFLAGLWFGRSDEPRAARTLLGDRVVLQPEVTAGVPEVAAPTSGITDVEPVCGIRTDPVPPEQQVATIMEGGVIVQYQPSELGQGEVERLTDWAKGYVSHLLIAPNPQIEAPIVATAFRNRMPLEELDTEVLGSFATGYGNAQGPMGSCPITGTG